MGLLGKLEAEGDAPGEVVAPVLGAAHGLWALEGGKEARRTWVRKDNHGMRSWCLRQKFPVG